MQDLRDKTFLGLEALRNNHERMVNDYEKRLRETQAALEASKPILTGATKLLSESRERCSKTEADFEVATAELAQQIKLLTVKEQESADTSRQMREVLAKLTAAEENIATREVELDRLHQQHSKQIQDIEYLNNARLDVIEVESQGYVLSDECRSGCFLSQIEKPFGPPLIAM